MTTVVRFAPSPTGLLHVGNARTALINWLYARRHRGRFILRFDDTDVARSRAEYAEATERDLRWLGLTWDQIVRQSDRLDRYLAEFEQLKQAGRVYACYETAEELEYKRRRQLARGQPPIYDRAGLALTAAERSAFEAEGRRPHWRFRLAPGAVSWTDLVRSATQFQAEHLSDPVVVRADGSFLYLLPSMIDDIDLGITHVIRGEDHVANTAAQIQMSQALGAEPPAFAHLPRLTDIAGKGLSKRLGSLPLASLREEGIEPMAVAGYLAALGTGDALRVRGSLDDLAQDFEISRFGRATPKFDEAQLRALNDRLLHESSYEAVQPRLATLGLGHIGPAFWEAVRPNLSKLEDVRYWHEVCFGDVEPVIEDAAFVDQALSLLPAEPWNGTTWETWTQALKAATGRRGRQLFHPLRLALTGTDHGPELKALLPLIGRRTVERRLRSGRVPA
jgi:glutamyl-tRNA synthetase